MNEQKHSYRQLKHNKSEYFIRNSISQQYENSVGPEATEDEEEAKYLAKRKMRSSC